MAKKKGQSTGPKTVAGKAKSSKNARKASIFTKAYLAWEDQVQQQEQLDQLTEQWQAYDPSRQLILRTIEHCQLGIERMMYAERLQIEGAMQSLDIATEFCARARFSPVEYMTVPSWYFMGEEGQWHKDHAVKLCKAYDQAKTFKAHYTDLLSAQVASQYPDLYRYVLSGCAVGTTFLTALGQQFKQATPVMNLNALINEIDKDYVYYLRWGQDPERYQAIVDGIRGERMLKVMDLERNSRYATAFQNRLIKGLTSLAAMDQHEQLMAEHSMTCLEYQDGSDQVVSDQLDNADLAVSDSEQQEE
jgi:hypothetical protein